MAEIAVKESIRLNGWIGWKLNSYPDRNGVLQETNGLLLWSRIPGQSLYCHCSPKTGPTIAIDLYKYLFNTSITGSTYWLMVLVTDRQLMYNSVPGRVDLRRGFSARRNDEFDTFQTFLWPFECRLKSVRSWNDYTRGSMGIHWNSKIDKKKKKKKKKKDSRTNLGFLGGAHSRRMFVSGWRDPWWRPAGEPCPTDSKPGTFDSTGRNKRSSDRASRLLPIVINIQSYQSVKCFLEISLKPYSICKKKLNKNTYFSKSQSINPVIIIPK